MFAQFAESGSVTKVENGVYYVLYETGTVSRGDNNNLSPGSSDSWEYTLSGPGAKLTVDAWSSGKMWGFGAGPKNTSITIAQGTTSFTDIRQDAIDETSKNYSFDLDKSANKIKVTLKGSLAQNYKNLKVTMAQYLEGAPAELTIPAGKVGVAASAPLSFKWCNLGSDITISSNNPLFTVDKATISAPAGSWNNAESVTVTCENTSVGTHTGVITISGGGKTIEVNVTSTVSKHTSTITWTPEATTINTIDKVTLPQTTSANLPIQYATSDAEIAYVNEAYELVIVKNGTVTITANAEGDEVYQAAPAVAHTFTINPTSYTVTIDAVATVEAGTALSDIVLTGSATDAAGNTVEGTLTWADATIVPTAGSTAEYDVVFTPTDTNYYAATSHKVSVTMNKQAHTIAWEQSTTYTMIDTIALTATSSVNFPITYVSLNEDVATINEDNTLTLHKAGEVTITASAEGNDSIDMAQTVEKVFSIALAPVTVTVTTPEAITVGTALNAISLAGTAKDANGVDVLGTFAFETPDATPMTTGTHKVIFTPENSTIYASATAEVEVTVNKLSQTITWNPTTELKTIDQVTFDATTSAEDIDVTYMVDNEEVASVDAAGKLTIFKAGQVTITASAAGNDIYTAAPAVAHTFTIDVTPYTVTINAVATVDFGTALSDIVLIGSVTDAAGNTVEGTLTWADATIVPTAGSTAEYDVVFTPTNTNYYAATSHKVSVTVNKQAHTIAWEQTTAYTMIDVIALTAASSADLPITYVSLNEDVATINEDNTLTLHKAGEVTITATAAGNEAYVDASLVEKTFSITLAPVTLTVNTPETITVGTALNAISLTGTAKDANGVDVLGTFAFETPDATPMTTSTHKVVFTPENSTIYASATAEVEVTVNKLSQTITWDAATTITTIDNITVPATTNEGIALTYESSAPTIAFINEQFELVIVTSGEVTITATAQATEVYEAISTAHTFTISKATYELTYDFSELKLELGNALNSLDAELLAKGIDANNNEVTGTLTFVEPNTIPTEIGVQTFDATFTPDNSNYYETKTITLSVEVFEQPGIGTALDNIKQTNSPARKVLRDGKVYIIRDGNTYTITGLKL